jgi:sugar/nucleoside kinase (ribokinase family)
MGPAVESSGGSAANTIVGVASFGVRAAFVGKVKDDELGRTFAHDIRAANVAFETKAASGGPSTARCYIMVTPDGERTMNTYLGAAQDLKPGDIDEAQVPRSPTSKAIYGIHRRPKKRSSRPQESRIGPVAASRSHCLMRSVSTAIVRNFSI